MPDEGDDEIVVIEPRLQRRGRGKAKPVPGKPSDVIEQTTDLRRARNVIEDVNRYRMLLAKRLSNITLFVTGHISDWRAMPQESDPPQIQVLWKLRQELDAAAAIDDPYQRTMCRTTLLRAMNETVNKATEEAGEAAEQYRKLMESASKLELERQKQGKDINPADVYMQASR